MMSVYCNIFYLVYILQDTANQCTGAGDVITIVGDLSIEDDVKRTIEKVIEHYKQLDVLVKLNSNLFSKYLSK